MRRSCVAQAFSAFTAPHLLEIRSCTIQPFLGLLRSADRVEALPRIFCETKLVTKHMESASGPAAQLPCIATEVREPIETSATEPASMEQVFQLPTLGGGQPNVGATPRHGSRLRFEFGSVRLPVSQIEELHDESIVRLSESAEAPIRVLRDGRLIAHGEVMIIDEQICIRVTGRFGEDD